MFRILGSSIARHWLLWIGAWALIFTVAALVAPPWNSVAKDGEFDFLPDRMPSRLGEALFQQAFPDEKLASNIVLVIHRPDGEIEAEERSAIVGALVPSIKRLAGLDAASSTSDARESDDAAQATSSDTKNAATLIARIRSPLDEGTGALLVSADHQALLIAVSLRSDFLDLRNREIVQRLEEIVETARQAPDFPRDLRVDFTGSAVVGRDLAAAKSSSARATEVMTLVLVITLLTLIYRAPLPALIPLVTVFVAIKLSMKLLSILALHGIVGVFDGVQTYITVIVYGAGVDYCIFLTARYREDLDAGLSFDEAIASALSNVGAAITASAGTVIGGIGMMVAAEFGKFQQAGIAISFSLIIVLLAALTLSAAILRWCGRWVFWPQRVGSGAVIQITSDAEPQTPAFWDRIGVMLQRRPGAILLVSFGLMLPFCGVAVWKQKDLSYGLIGNLPAAAPSVQGTRALQAHFATGSTGPLTLLVQHPDIDFSSGEGRDIIERVTSWMAEHRDELHLADVRSLDKPLGITSAAESAFEAGGLQAIAKRRVLLQKSLAHYVSSTDSLSGHVTRFDVVFQHDPFSREAIDRLNEVEPQLKAAITELLPAKSIVRYFGPTASIRDLKAVRTGDQTRISWLVCTSVFVILVLLLRRPFISLYLIVSVLVSYVTTYGATYLTFWAIDPTGFSGLDWKLPMLLFTILVAVGEDYNIFLMARIEEEQRRHGPEQGILVALSKTGRIISSCGLIMAGTFSALMFGSLVSSRQLGYALAFGVLLDTFLVRPILVPAFLIWLVQRKKSGPAP